VRVGRRFGCNPKTRIRSSLRARRLLSRMLDQRSGKAPRTLACDRLHVVAALVARTEERHPHAGLFDRSSDCRYLRRS
jgi:hypothetical protein